MPQVAQGVRVAWLDPAAAWAAAVGTHAGTRFEAAAVARAALLYDDEKAGVREQQEWEAVIFPLHAGGGRRRRHKRRLRRPRPQRRCS